MDREVSHRRYRARKAWDTDRYRKERVKGVREREQQPLTSSSVNTP